MAYYSFGSAALAATFALTSSFLSGVHRLLLLVTIFSLSAGLYLLYDFYFLGLAYVIIYCGAIAIIFLFVLMMISLDRSVGVAFTFTIPLALAMIGLGIMVMGSADTEIAITTYFYPVFATLPFPLAGDIFNFSILIYLAYPISLVIIAVALWVVLLGIIKLVA